MSDFSARAAFKKVPVRHQLGGAMAAEADRRSRAIPFNPLKPFDRHRFADLVAPRRCAAAHFPPLHRIDHASLANRALAFLLASAQPTG